MVTTMLQELNASMNGARQVAAETTLDGLIRKAALAKCGMAVLCVELMSLASISQQYGKHAGNTVLEVAATRMGAFADRMDLVFQISGEQLLIVLPTLPSTDHVTWFAETMAARLESPIVFEEQVLSCQVRVGGALAPARVHEPLMAATLIAQARTAMMQVGQDLTRRYQPYVEGGEERRLRAQNLTLALSHAVGMNQLSLVFQPQLNLRKPTRCKVEALLRWKHPTLGPISPAEFIPLAERTGMILPIGRWVMLEACRQAAAWADEAFGPVDIAVNVSPAQFADPDLVDDICDVLKETGLDPRRLTLEVTEGMLVQDIMATADMIARLRALGMGIAIDDFGAGQSSLAYLADFDVTELKLDRCFVMPATAGKQARTVVAAVVALAHRIGLEVVGEGVETAEQREALTRIGCDWIQGYHHARPMPAADVVAFFDHALTRRPTVRRSAARAAQMGLSAHPL